MDTTGKLHQPQLRTRGTRHGSRIQADIIHSKAAGYPSRSSNLHRVRLGGEGLRTTRGECRAEISVARSHKSLKYTIASGTPLLMDPDAVEGSRSQRRSGYPQACEPFRRVSFPVVSRVNAPTDVPASVMRTTRTWAEGIAASLM